MIAFIVVQLEQEGVHRWQDAPDEVFFLRDFHRHIFKVTVKIQVFHDDRELEFIMVKRVLQSYLERYLQIRGSNSCEMISRDIIDYILEKYGDHRFVEVITLEDGENGGGVIHSP